MAQATRHADRPETERHAGRPKTRLYASRGLAWREPVCVEFLKWVCAPVPTLSDTPLQKQLPEIRK